MKEKIKKYISIVLFIIGILFILIYFYQENITGYLAEKTIKNIENKEEYLPNETTNEGLVPDYNTDNVEEATLVKYLQNSGNFRNVKVKGRLVSPVIRLNLPILEGVNETHLLIGASEQKPRAEIKVGQIGNYILSSHKMSYKRNLGFSRINRLKPGDIVYATDENNVYAYKVVYNKVFPITDTSPINEDTDTESWMTLYTCEKFGKNTNKVVVRTKLEGRKPLKSLNRDEYDILFKKN